MRYRVLLSLLLAAACVVTLAPVERASAAGGNYVFDGGSTAEQGQVTAALNASAFNWSLVTSQVTIHIVRNVATEATPGNIWVDANLLDAGRFSWGIVQHEYAHQVDFFLLNDTTRTTLQSSLGGQDWCYGVSGLPHSAYGCERFASVLAWSYWQSSDNALQPQRRGDESSAMAPAAFRTLMVSLLGSGASTATISKTTLALAPTVAAAPKPRCH
ncbi:MAG: hypothetical protein F2663_05540 [Actinobacteria bacterium]|uniref:Unannotated protein n=1 Tax=freshwater metagenome TaxID=449393 RepID=A0A6J6PFN3_9ZZZZ|nr:hypothetical protein [Actinomycetota bacterium]